MESKPKTVRKARPKKKATKTRAPRKPRAQESLPPPIEINQPKPPAEKPQPESGLLSGIESLFTKSQSQEPEAENQVPSGSSSSVTEPLTPEAERILQDIPDVIGDVSATDSQAPVPPAESLALSTFDSYLVGEYLEEGYGFIAKVTNMEHWKLTDRQSKLLAPPLAKVLSSMSDEMTGWLPGFLKNWVERTPGAAGLLIAMVAVNGPKIAQTVTVLRERSKAAQVRVPKVTPMPTPRPAAPGSKSVPDVNNWHPSEVQP